MKCRFLSLVFATSLTSSVTASVNPFISNYFFNYIEKDKETAVTYLLKNADIIPDAAYILAVVYLESDKLALAEEFLNKAASKNYAPALNCLGNVYYSDKQDLEQAQKFYKQAAEQGYGPAQFQLGIVYLKHFKKYKEAKRWLKKASLNKKDLSEEVRESAIKYLKIAEQNLR